MIRNSSTKIDVENNLESYIFNWPGKKVSAELAFTPSKEIISEAPGESIHFESTKNKIIEADNLDALKWLKKDYKKQIKTIYIDPPYNTGKDFVYKDQFQKFGWLNMIYPRLILARELLREDGNIFVSIGVEELANLKKILDEVFGEENFIEIFSWIKTSTPPALSVKSRKTIEYIICFEKNKNSSRYNGMALDGGDQPLLNTGNTLKTLRFPKDKVLFNSDKFPNGKYLSQKTKKAELLDGVQIKNGFSTKDFRLKGEFKWTQKFLDNEIKKGTHFVIKSKLFSIRFIRKQGGYKRPNNLIIPNHFESIISKRSGVGTNENAKSDLINIMGDDFFDYPKPVSLIKYLLNFNIEANDIILDFFAGSGTTGEAVMQLNAEKKMNLQYILVQSQEPLNTSKSVNNNTRLKNENAARMLLKNSLPLNIAELCKQRIKLAGKRIKESKDISDSDLGFKVYKKDKRVS